MKKAIYLILLLFAGTAFAQNIEFNVNMSVKAQEGVFDPAGDSVFVAGTFTNWGTSMVKMSDDNTDSIYSVTIAVDTISFDTFGPGDTLLFKFVLNGSAWESDPNRELIVTENDTTYTAWFDRDSVVSQSIELTFSCNMEFEIASGRFDPATDTLTVRGSFNGWSGDDRMTAGADPNYYEITIDHPATLNEVLYYKFAFINETGVTWEQNPSPSQENYQDTITADQLNAGSKFIERTFNNLTLDNVTNNPVTIKFVVNVNGAISSLTGTAFPSIDTVVVAGANPPLQWPTGGWPNTDSAAVKYMYNDGTHGDEVAGDSLWSLDLVFPQYSSLRVQYKYGANWALPSNTGGNDNESSIGTDHYIDLTPDLVSATVRNQWSVMGDHQLVDVVTTGVEELDGQIPMVYSLLQNYPNPFNPATNIRFAIPEAGLVTIKVYNLLGQEVSTLINEFKNAGTYQVDFNAGNLSSGVYFYSINAGNFTSTRKMILMK